MKYSAFTFVHNALEGGYPIREAVRAFHGYAHEIAAVDMGSTDRTREALLSLGSAVRIINGKWGNLAEETLGAAHALHAECVNETIIHFEADEVWDRKLISHVMANEISNAIVYRIQVEQNFQRVRWAPHQVHRVFPRGKATKDPTRGHTTKEHDTVPTVIGPEHGMIWDCSNCFRDNWKKRVEQNAELWNGEAPPYYRRAPDHFMEKPYTEDTDAFLSQPHWTWKTTYLDIPEILMPLVGQVRYA